MDSFLHNGIAGRLCVGVGYRVWGHRGARPSEPLERGTMDSFSTVDQRVSRRPIAVDTTACPASCSATFWRSLAHRRPVLRSTPIMLRMMACSNSSTPTSPAAARSLPVAAPLVRQPEMRVALLFVRRPALHTPNCWARREQCSHSCKLHCSALDPKSPCAGSPKQPPICQHCLACAQPRYRPRLPNDPGLLACIPAHRAGTDLLLCPLTIPQRRSWHA
jgi:hypothetical protein